MALGDVTKRKYFPSYVDVVLRHAAHDPMRAAIGTESGILSYGQLAHAAQGATQLCHRSGIAAGHVVGILIEDPVWHITLAIALHRLGAVSVSLSPEEVSLPLGLQSILSDRAVSAGFGGAVLTVDAKWFTPGPDVDSLPKVNLPGNALCRIALSSGTTGTPKAIAMSPEILWHRFTTYAMRGRFSVSEKILCGPQLRSHFGFAVAFSALMAGKMVCFSNSASSTVPLISYFGVDLAILSVHQVSELADVQREQFGGLSSLREIQAGGSKISDQLLAKIKSTIACSLLNTYASTEAGTAAVGHVEALGNLREKGAVGVLAPWSHVVSCDEKGNELPEGEVGNLRVSSLGMAPPYVVGMKTVEEPEFFFPGDVGFVSKERLLFVEGRSSEIINLGGNKIAPGTIEKVVLECAGVKDAAVFAITERTELPQITVVVEAETGFDPKQVMKHCGERLGILTPTAIRVVDKIPRNVTGKIMYDRLKEMFAKAV
jgi:acyl-coenzyme A synthetase/AMP-(fatty) acid ligase